MEKLEHYHHHIDNGGISVDVDYDLENGGVQISLRTSYFGYPEVAATLRTWGGVNSADFLQELSLLFMRASVKALPAQEAFVKKMEGAA